MLARTRLKLRNAEKSIDFMQEQHTEILEGLHQEMDKLQKKNARLTFQLTMNGGENLTGKGDHQLQDALISTGSELAKVKLSLSKEQQKTALLQIQVEDLLSKQIEELTLKDDMVKKLSIELDSKAELVVLLTQQIYRLRAKLKQEFDNAAAQSAICSCPHCYVHSKVSPEARVLMNTPTQGSSTSRKRVPLRKSDGYHHSHSGSPPKPDDSSKYPGRNLVPTPPPSTPPLSASSRRRAIFKMASNPEIGTVSLATDANNDSPYNHEVKMPQDNCIMKRKSQIPREGNHMKIRNAHRDNTRHMFSSRELEDEKESVSRTVYRNSPAILPPIVTPPSPDFNEHFSSSNSTQVLELDKLPDASLAQHHHHHHHHKASYLAKFPGLSSAPPGSLHVLHRSNRQKGHSPISGVGVSEEDSSSSLEQPEGMLLVKENEEKASDSRACWAKGTPALDSVK